MIGNHRKDAVTKWGDFQSVIQLSIALNAAYAALSSYIGTSLTREKRLISELLDQLKAVDPAEPTVPLLRPPHDPSRLKIELRALIGECVKAERRFEGAINRFLRPVCIAASLIGLVLIVLSSIYYNDEIKIGWLIVSCGLLLPFAIGASMSMLMSAQTYLDISKRRREHEQKFLQ